MDILQTIIEAKREENRRLLARMPREALRGLSLAKAAELGPRPSLRKAIEESPTGVIAEFKRRSPSRGWIAEGADPVGVARGYERAGAAAMSVLADRQFFAGDPAFLEAIARSGVRLPLLYKEFVVDPCQLLLAKGCGASAVLLIAAALPLPECCALIAEAKNLGLEVLLEVHSEEELRYAEAAPDLIGVNNRALGTFRTDTAVSLRLAPLLPAGIPAVSESGISGAATIRALREAGYRGFLIGGHLMESADPGAALSRLLAGEAP